MELSGSNIKRFLEMKTLKKLLIFPKIELFSPSSKNKKNSPRENFLYFYIKKILIFSQKRAFLIFQETETPKKFFIFQETEPFYILGNGNTKKTCHISRSNFPSSKNGKTTLLKSSLHFSKGNFPIFQEVTCKALKSKKKKKSYTCPYKAFFLNF